MRAQGREQTGRPKAGIPPAGGAFGGGRQGSLIDKIERLILHAGTDEATREVARRKLRLVSGADADRRQPAIDGLEPDAPHGEPQAALAIGQRGGRRDIRHWTAAPESQVLNVLA